METTPNLTLPYIMPSQAQKHVTHNEAVRALDALVQLCIIDRDLTTPPVDLSEGDRYIVAEGASGAWAGNDGKIAAWQDGGWTFFNPLPGWSCFVADEEMFLYWSGTGWHSLADTISMLQNLQFVGIGTQADNANPFAAKLNKALWTSLDSSEGGDGDLRYTMNKQSAGNVLSLLMQSNWSGRAEIGLVGDDDLAIKVSSDGLAWKEALRVKHETGTILFPNTNILTDYAVNLLPDSGRFSASATSNGVGEFAWPSYFETVNGSTAADLGKFIYDNSSYGGSAGALVPEIKDLIDKIRHPDFRRYNPEFRVARVSMGSGSAAATLYQEASYPLSLRLERGPYPPCSTFHIYLRAETERVVLRHYPWQTIYKNGIPFSSNVAVDPAEGWVAVMVHDARDPYSSFAHNPTPFTLQAMGAGDTYLIACAALMGGIINVDSNIGVIPGVNRWLP